MSHCVFRGNSQLRLIAGLTFSDMSFRECTFVAQRGVQRGKLEMFNFPEVLLCFISHEATSLKCFRKKKKEREEKKTFS